MEVSSHVYPINDTSSLTLYTADEVPDINSSVSRPSFASIDTSIASYKTEKSINSRKSRYNALPRQKYADTPHLRPPRGPVSSDVDGASILEVCQTFRRQDSYNYITSFFRLS